LRGKIRKKWGGREMQYIELYEARVPVIGLGTWDLRGEICQRAVLSALNLGYRHIDTAQSYANEEEIGKALQSSPVPREEIFLTTKVWYTHLRYSEVIQALEESLRKLKTDYVDLYLIHWPSEDVPLEETMSAMIKVKEEGKTRYIGVSNFDVPLLEKARQISPYPILTDQVEFHPYYSQRELLNYCQKNKVILTAYSPLARRRLSDDLLLQEIGKKYGKTANQVALRWLIQQEMVVAIPKAASPEHQRENLDIFDFELTPEEMEKISRLDRREKVASRI